MTIYNALCPLLSILLFLQSILAVPLGTTPDLSLSLPISGSLNSLPLSHNLTNIQPSNLSATTTTGNTILTGQKWKIAITEAIWAIEGVAPTAYLYEVESRFPPMTLRKLPFDPSGLQFFTVTCYDPQGEGASRLISVEGTRDLPTGQIRWTEPKRSTWSQSWWVPPAMFWPPNHDPFEASALMGRRVWSAVTYQHHVSYVLIGRNFAVMEAQVFEFYNGRGSALVSAIFDATTLQGVSP